MKLAWVDVETTGLDIQRDYLLEIALVITTETLEPIYTEGYVLNFHADNPDHGDALSRMDQNVLEMHDASGLLTACRKSIMRPRDVDANLATAIDMSCFGEKPLLAGSSVHFDRKFIDRDLPRLSSLLHYRHFDVSVFHRAFEMWAPELKMPEKDKSPGPANHRAMPDILHSIEVAKYYRSKMFKEG